MSTTESGTPAPEQTPAKSLRRNMWMMDIGTVLQGRVLSSNGTQPLLVQEENGASAILGNCERDNMGTDAMPKQMDDSLLHLYNYFNNMKGETLKKICRQWGLRRSGAKGDLVSRLTVHVQKSSDSGTNEAYTSFLQSSCQCAGFALFDRRTAKKVA